eukprot:TRINITY_DN786_c0_g1_i1.p2 TRINITY_DN786_c0_g1~~TRINITY_DN786_c0_g1_i1.p2  ORF type:complete len:129 (-),score=31.89 TRINITY_DN786_c0_g1_i1:110-496(-)
MSNWNEQIENPDSRVKWAMDVMDQEGEQFEGVIGKSLTPTAFGAFPLVCNWIRNGMSRLPQRTNMFAALCMVPVAGTIGYGFRKWVDKVHTEEDAMMRHYILTHPELFPEPRKVKYIDHVEPWRPMRW